MYISGVTILFPIKLKVTMVFTPAAGLPTITELGFAGGFALGTNPSQPAFSAYAQVLIDLDTPTNTAGYFQLGKTSLGLMIQSFAQVRVPDWLGDFISVDSFIVNYNPNFAAVGSLKTPVNASSNSLVVKNQSDCLNALALLSFTPPFPGVSCFFPVSWRCVLCDFEVWSEKWFL